MPSSVSRDIEGLQNSVKSSYGDPKCAFIETQDSFVGPYHPGSRSSFREVEKQTNHVCVTVCFETEDAFFLFVFFDPVFLSVM